MCAGKPGGRTLAESAGWLDLMKLVQRAGGVVTEDMPVDPDARDLQVSQCFAALASLDLEKPLMPLLQWLVGRQLGHGVVLEHSGVKVLQWGGTLFRHCVHQHIHTARLQCRL